MGGPKITVRSIRVDPLDKFFGQLSRNEKRLLQDLSHNQKSFLPQKFGTSLVGERASPTYLFSYRLWEELQREGKDPGAAVYSELRACMNPIHRQLMHHGMHPDDLREQISALPQEAKFPDAMRAEAQSLVRRELDSYMKFWDLVQAGKGIRFVGLWNNDGRLDYETPLSGTMDPAVYTKYLGIAILMGVYDNSTPPDYALKGWKRLERGLIRHEERLKDAAIKNNLKNSIRVPEPAPFIMPNGTANPEASLEGPRPHALSEPSKVLLKQLRALSEIDNDLGSRAKQLVQAINTVHESIDVSIPGMKAVGDRLFSVEQLSLLCMTFGVFESLSNKPQVVHKGKRNESFRLDSSVKEVMELCHASESGTLWLSGMFDRSEATLVLAGLTGIPTVGQPLARATIELARMHDMKGKHPRTATGLKSTKATEEIIQEMRLQRVQLKKIFDQETPVNKRSAPQALDMNEVQDITAPDWLHDMVNDTYDISVTDTRIALTCKTTGLELLVKPADPQEEVRQDFRRFQQEVEQVRAYETILRRLRTKNNFTMTEQEDGSVLLQQERLSVSAMLSGSIEERLTQVMDLYNDYLQREREEVYKSSRTMKPQEDEQRYHPAALLEHQQAILVLDTNILISLDAVRGENARNWLDLLKHTVNLPNITLVVPSLVADREFRGRQSVILPDGTVHDEVVHHNLRSSTFGRVNDIAARDRFFKDARRMKLRDDGSIQTALNGDNPNIIIWESPLDRAFYRESGRARASNTSDTLDQRNLGEKSIESMLQELPFNAPVFVLSEDREYMASAELHTSPVTGMPITRTTLFHLLDSEFNVRPAQLQVLMREPRHIDIDVYVADRHRSDPEWRGGLPQSYINGVSDNPHIDTHTLKKTIKNGVALLKDGRAADDESWSLKLGMSAGEGPHVHAAAITQKSAERSASGRQA